MTGRIKVIIEDFEFDLANETFHDIVVKTDMFREKYGVEAYNKLLDILGDLIELVNLMEGVR